LVEDDAAHARWLHDCIQEVSPLQVTHQVRSADALRQLLPSAPAPALLLLDLQLDGPDSGLDVLPDVHRCWPGTPILVVSQHSDGPRLVQALRHGARGYVVKDGNSTTVIRAIRAVLAGQILFSPEVARHVIALARPTQAPGAPPTTPPLRLSRRERDVLDCLADGLTYAETAERLDVARSTVESHVRNLYRKLDATSKVTALRRARLLGLLGLHP
jgi:DNA-binding NarL/FixJ family response regulator